MLQNIDPKVNPTRRTTQAPVFKLEYPLPPTIPPTREALMNYIKKHECASCQRMVDVLQILMNQSFAVTVTFLQNGKPHRQQFHLCGDCAFKLGTDAARRKRNPKCELWFDIQSQILRNYRHANPEHTEGGAQ